MKTRHTKLLIFFFANPLGRLFEPPRGSRTTGWEAKDVVFSEMTHYISVSARNCVRFAVLFFCDPSWLGSASLVIAFGFHDAWCSVGRKRCNLPTGRQEDKYLPLVWVAVRVVRVRNLFSCNGEGLAWLSHLNNPFSHITMLPARVRDLVRAAYSKFHLESVIIALLKTFCTFYGTQRFNNHQPTN
jgi:hypothetical protein